MDEMTRLRRGLVLHTLYKQYPLALADAALEASVLPAFHDDRTAYLRDRAYLADLGLIVQDGMKVAGRRLETWKLTAAGVDVVEGSTTLPGVNIGKG